MIVAVSDPLVDGWPGGRGELRGGHPQPFLHSTSTTQCHPHPPLAARLRSTAIADNCAMRIFQRAARGEVWGANSPCPPRAARALSHRPRGVCGDISAELGERAPYQERTHVVLEHTRHHERRHPVVTPNYSWRIRTSIVVAPVHVRPLGHRSTHQFAIEGRVGGVPAEKPARPLLRLWSSRRTWPDRTAVATQARRDYPRDGETSIWHRRHGDRIESLLRQRDEGKPSRTLRVSAMPTSPSLGRGQLCDGESVATDQPRISAGSIVARTRGRRQEWLKRKRATHPTI